jgi:hypothetical protein
MLQKRPHTRVHVQWTWQVPRRLHHWHAFNRFVGYNEGYLYACRCGEVRDGI